MKWIKFFNEFIKPNFPSNTVFRYSSYLNGDLGDLDRVEFEISNKIGGIDFWSKGWVSMDVVKIDSSEDYDLLNILHSPDEKDEIQASFYLLVKIINDNP